MIRKQCCSLFALSLLAVTANAQQDNTFAIRGRVVDAAMKPVAGAAVRLLAPTFNGFDVDEKATTDAEGRFAVAAPKSWTRMDSSQRQELSLVATEGNRIAMVQFNRNSAPPKADVELVLASAGGSKITVLGPNLKPVAGAKVKIAGLRCDTIRVDLTDEELRQFAGKARKTPIGYVVSTGVIALPPEFQMEAGATDDKGVVTVPHVDSAKVGGITVNADEFGEQSIAHYSFGGAQPPGWPQRIVLKPTGRVIGQLTSSVAEAIAQRELTLSCYQQDLQYGIIHGSTAKIVTDREGKFEAPKMIAGTVNFTVKFDPGHPTRPAPTANPPQLKANETLQLKIELKPAVRVEGRVLDAAAKTPIRDVQVRAFFGMGFESTTSDAEGKFAFWMAPGETAFHPDIPEDYLPALAPSDYFDAVKRQQTVTIFKVPEGKRFDAPPILLHRAATLRGVIVDDGGKPLPGTGVSGISMSIDRRTGQPKPREVTAKTDARGEFSIAGLDPREALRLRVTAKETAKVVTIAKPGSDLVRIVVAPTERFQISGNVVDAEGKPVADAVLEVWHRDWRPPPAQAEPKKLALKEPIRADGQGRFTTPALSPDGSYRFTVRAAGAKTTETAWLDATNPEAAKPQQLVVVRLGGVSGMVRDRAGKPIADVQVILIAKDARTETATSSQGELKLETPVGKPFCVVVRHPDFRAAGTYYEKQPPDLNHTMARLGEPGEKLALRPALAKAERDKMLTRLIEPFKQKLAKSTSTQEKLMALQSLTGPAPEFVTEFLEKHPLQPQYNEMLLTQVAMKRVSHNPEEAEELIGRMKPGAQQSMAYGMLADALPEKARARKLEILAEALVGARAEKSPEFRAISMGKVATHLWLLDDKDRATKLLREAEKIANGLSTSAFAGYARGCFATDLALIDLPAALALMKDLKDPDELARHHGNTAHRIARVNPAGAVKVLDLIGPPGPNRFNQRDQYAIRVGYRIAQVDLPAALKLASSITDAPSQAYALGVIAQAASKNDPKQALDIMRRAFALLEEDAARPDPPQLTSPLTAASVAAALVLVAEQIDATLVRECLWRSVALRRPDNGDPQEVWRYMTSNNGLALAAARYDGKLAEFLLPSAPTEWASRESKLAQFLANPQRAVEAAEKAPKGKDDRELAQLIGYLSTEPDHVPRLIFNSIGMWRIDVEDIDF